MYNRKLCAVLAAVLMLAAVLFGLRGRPVGRDAGLYVTDPAGVISAAERSAIEAASAGRADGISFSVAAVRTTGRASAADYCEELWSRWHLGSGDALLLLDIGGDDYYFIYSDTLADRLDSRYRALLDDRLEPCFTKGEYGAGALSLAQGFFAAAEGSIATGGWQSALPSDPGINLTVVLPLAGIALIVLLLILAARSGRKRRGYARPRRTFFFTPRPPRPPRPPRYAAPPPPHRPRPGGSRPGGFSGGGRSRGGGFSGGGRSHGGGFSGGGRAGGGHGGGGRR